MPTSPIDRSGIYFMKVQCVCVCLFVAFLVCLGFVVELVRVWRPRQKFSHGRCDSAGSSSERARHERRPPHTAREVRGRARLVFVLAACRGCWCGAALSCARRPPLRPLSRSSSRPRGASADELQLEPDHPSESEPERPTDRPQATERVRGEGGPACVRPRTSPLWDAPLSLSLRWLAGWGAEAPV
jgi:hypothetical protein